MKTNLLFNPNQHLKERYQLQQQLGNNAGRQTWLAQDLQSGEQVTVKLLAFNPQMEWDEFKLFEREAAVLKQLNHPRIPQYRDYFSLNQKIGAGLCWFGLVQDYIPGKSLQQLLNEGKRFTESQVRSIAKQVLEILIYLHGLNSPVLHRDIKPSNLILGEDKQIYLVDFGAVQDSAAVEGVTFTVVGTSGYAPLEQFWGQAVPASDLYALGATLIHLLTGVSPADLPQRNLRIQFREQVSINSQLISWIEALTEPDLDLRLSCASQALDALETGQSIRSMGYPLETVHPPFSTRIKLKKNKNKLIIYFSTDGIVWFIDSCVFLSIKLIPFFSLILLLLIVNMVLILVGFQSLVNSYYSLIDIIIVLFFVLICMIALGKAGLIQLKKMYRDIRNFIRANFWGYSVVFDIDKMIFQRFDFHLRISEIQEVAIYNSGQAIDYSGQAIDYSGNAIYLKTRKRNYCLANRLKPSESNWLVGEITDWLANCQ
ncbi:protein kinase domain [Coleofasciculus chthonoplastes PCC 7420]|uniref:Protein kinase domain n=1 Tax=Coleofasciculus chthonoplastes PCC 7420 TaxID=118168 RepID=B4W4F7_9CYAN|nr:serine/threonine-protein kinase [Coleofasciculus chthonoplastes]EDX70936.1 protein kinase domain [Coleofasciculus chthonoplastes PCC 7420]